MSATDGITTAGTTITEVLARRSMERPPRVLIADELQEVLTAPRENEERPPVAFEDTKAATGQLADERPGLSRLEPRIDVRA